jgi:hypothetical protein
MIKRPKKSKGDLLVFRIELEGTDPLVWRRFIARGNLTFFQLHNLIQKIMGWSNSHLFVFFLSRDDFIGTAELNDSADCRFRDARLLRVDEVFVQPGFNLGYEYDLGDSWVHRIYLENRCTYSPDLEPVPICIAGEQACPPENCGGVSAFEHLKKVVSDPGHEEFQAVRSWLGQDYDPARFSIDDINRKLKPRPNVEMLM